VESQKVIEVENEASLEKLMNELEIEIQGIVEGYEARERARNEMQDKIINQLRGQAEREN
jgi:hypothetical protein